MSVVAHDTAWLASLSLAQLQQELCLAASRLATAHMAAAGGGWSAQCHECGASHREDLLHIPHREGCRTGAVARVLYELASRQVQPNPTPRKETAQADSGAAARETRPCALPYLVVSANALPGLHGEPWAMDESGAVHDAAGHTIAEPVGCDLVEPDDLRALERMVACVNYCDGIATRDLERASQIGGAM